MKKIQQYLILAVVLFSSLIMNGQEEKEEAHSEKTEHAEHSEHAEEFKRHSLSLFIAHSFISQGVTSGKRDWLIVPSFALNYNYSFSHKWALGLHTDLIVEDFVIEQEGSDEEVLEREFPFSALLVGSHKLTKNFGIAFGFGIEWETTKSFAVARFGVDYGIEIPSRELEVIFALNYDIIVNAYDSFNLGFGIAKKF